MDRAKQLFQHCKIVTSFRGHLTLKEENLKQILDAVDPAFRRKEGQDQSKNPQVAILAIIGPPKSGKTFFTNLLIQFYESGDGGWLIKDGKEPVKGFHWDSVLPQESLFKPVTNGIYLWPVPFSVKKPGEDETFLVWIMNLVITRDDSEQDKEILEKFLSVACSRITEIIWKNDNVRILEIRRDLRLPDSEDAPRQIEAEKICDSVVFINRSGIKSSTKPLTDDEAKDEMKNLVKCPELISTFDDFEHVNVLLMKDCEQDLHDSSGILNPEVMKKEFRSIKKIVETIADESEVLPKKFGSGNENVFTLDNMFQYFRTIVDQLNPKSIPSVQSFEKRLLSRTDDNNGTDMPNVPLPTDSDSGTDEGSFEMIDGSELPSPEPTKPPIHKQRISERMFKEEEQARQKSIETGCRRHSSSTGVDDVQIGWRRSIEFGEQRPTTASSRGESSYFSNSNTDKKMEENRNHWPTPSHTSPKHVSSLYVGTRQYQSHSAVYTHTDLSTEAFNVENIMTQSDAKAEIALLRKNMNEERSIFFESSYSSSHSKKPEPVIYDIKIQVENEKMDVDDAMGCSIHAPPPQNQNSTEAKAMTESEPMDVDTKLEDEVQKFMIKEGKKVQDAGLQGEFQEQTEKLANSNAEANRRHSKEVAARKQFQEESQISFEELEAKRKEEEEKEERRKQKEEEEARKKEEEERKRKDHEQQLDIMNEISTLAITQVRQFLPCSTQQWINECLTPLNIADLKKLYDHTRDGVLEESRSKVHGALWNKFVKLVDDACRSGCTKQLTKIHDAAFSFKKHVDMKFSHCGYFSDVGKLLDEEFNKVCRNLEESDKVFVLPAIQSACERLANMFRKHNKLIVETEQINAQNVIPVIKNFYNDEMKRFLRETPFAPTDLRQIHGELRDKCVEAFRKALTLGENRANGVIDVQPLKDEINRAYDAQKESNDTKLRRLQLETNKIIQSYKTQYTEQMENVLKKNPDGLEARDFHKKHENISNEVKKLLEMDIKNKIRADEPMEEHLKSLQSHIDKYWDVVLKENAKNWKQGQERKREAEREQKRLEAQRKLEEKSKPKPDEKPDSVEPSASGSKSELGKSRKSAEAGNASLPPLVFQLGSKRVVMGMMVEGMPQVIGNEFKEPYTLAVVGLTKDDELIYGTEAVNLLDHEKQSGESLVKAHWWIADCLICGETAWTDHIKIEGDFPKVTVEFLIGFLLRKMKLAAESQLGGTSSTAVIAVPFWLSSTQRIQVKDGARVAGFSEVYLVNEASAAAYACVKSESRRERANRMIVLSENSGTFDATVFEYSNHPTKITTIGHCGSYDIDSKKKGTIKSMLREGFSLITDALQFFFGGGGSTGTGTIYNADVNEDTIRKLCRKALDQAQSSQKHSMNGISSTNETLVICESETYRRLLDKVGREQARRVSDTYEEYAVITGAVLLGQAPKEIGYKIQDKIAFELSRKCGAEQGTMVFDKSYPLPTTNKTCSTTLPKFCKDAFFFQTAIDCVIPVGNLFSVKDWFPSTHDIEPHFNLTNEGIFTLKHILVKPRKWKKVAEYLDENYYQWCTPKLSEEELTKFASLLELTQPSPPPASAVGPSQEDPELMEARQNLLDRCNEMMDWYEKNNESAFRSDLARELYTTKVNDAKNFTQHPNASVDDLKKQFDALDKYYQKYCAK